MAVEKCVLSIQSHVVHGYVGNKCATFTLQVLGFDVDAINTVHFSNHTGYPAIKGERLTGEQFDCLVDGLRANNLIRHSHALTGYIGTPTALRAALSLVQELKKRNPSLVYLCDPVLGDNGHLYVPPELVDIYRDEGLQFANIVTPNQFEAELLSGTQIKSLAEARKVAGWFHAKGVERVVISSMELPGDVQGKGNLVLLGSCQRKEGPPDQFTITMPQLQMSFTGSGDTLSALILGWNEIEHDFASVCEKAVAAMQAVLKNTMEHAALCNAAEVLTDGSRNPLEVASRELRLIQSKRQLENPTVLLRAQKLA